jgi:TolB-like protein
VNLDKNVNYLVTTIYTGEFMLRSLTAVIVFFMMITGIVSVKAEETSDVSRVMVLPFDGTSSGNFSYLTDSIRAMVSSRLAAKQGVEVVDYSGGAEGLKMLEGTDSQSSGSAAFFAKYDTDYVISGALYALQTGLKIQVNLTGQKTTNLPGEFTSLAISEGHIISSIEEIVEDIVSKGFGVDNAVFSASVENQVAGTGLSGFGTEHPEKIFKKGIYGGSIVADGGMQVESLGVRRSSDLPLTIVSMASGDIDNDGSREVVVASRTDLEIYRFEETVFRKVASYNFPKSYKIHAVNLADLNKDGMSEIYVSANNGVRVSSSIMTWDKTGGMQPLLTGIDWYIRPVEKSGAGWFLAGQRGSTESAAGYVATSIVKLRVLSNFDAVEPDVPLHIPKNIRLFDFVWADIDGNGVQEIVSIDRREKLMVYDGNNSLIWVSENDYGGSRNFFGPPQSAVTSATQLFGNDNSTSDRQIIYIPTRLLVADLDNDGGQEILVANNFRTTPKLFSNLREYDGGTVVCLKWQDTVMQDVWKTNKIEGYVTDYYFEDYSGTETNKVATNSLYISQIPDKQLLGFSMGAESKVLKYDFNISTPISK